MTTVIRDRLAARDEQVARLREALAGRATGR